jgi:hypothetical protein
VKKARITLSIFESAHIFTRKGFEGAGFGREGKPEKARVTVEKTANRAGRFFHGDSEFGCITNHSRRSNMPIVKKAPGIMTREVRLEEPVNELLEDYARFIESNPDHVINAVLKKVLWRDQDYRKWRGERRTTHPTPDKGQTSEARPRT